MSGTDNVASMVVFTNGIPNKAEYRKFKMRLKGNDDYAHMKEAISRRLSPKNVKAWGLPSLFLIDGGKGQLSSAIESRDASGHDIPMIGLAKREEEIVVHKSSSNVQVVVPKTTHSYRDVVVMDSEDFSMVRLGQADDITKLLQRVRDESHRFAVTYHSTLKRNRQTTSWLDDVPGVGPTTKRKLLRHFGSAKGVLLARGAELEKLLGEKQTTILQQYIRAEKKQ
jgi:excinuclease ABC subunit C